MSFNVDSAKATGRPDTSGWSQVHIYKPEEHTKFKLRGQLFAVITITRKQKKTSELKEGESVERVFAGREVLSRLHEEYFGKTQGSVLDALKKAIEKVVGESPEQENVEIAAVTVLAKVAYLVASGGSEIAIFRDGVFSRILTSNKGKVVSASGYLKDKDIFVVATGAFFSKFTNGVIKAAISSGDPDLAVESLAPAIHSQKFQGNLAVLFLRFDKDLVEETRLIDKQSQRLAVQVEKQPKALSLVGTSGQKLPDKKEGLSRTFKKTLSGIVEKVPRKKMYVRSEKQVPTQRKKTSLSVGLILLFVLITSIFFGVKQKKQVDHKASYQTRLDQAEHELAEAQEIYSMSPARARELFINAQERVLGLETEGVADPDLENLKRLLATAENEILGIYKVAGELFVDLSLLSSGFSGDLINSTAERIFVLDKEGEKVVSIAIETKRTEVVAGPSQIADPEGLASYSDRAFILNSKGVFEVGEDFDKAIDKGWEGEALPYAYAGNFYILDKATSTIWRHSGGASGFSSGSNWFASGTEVDLSKAASWVIDGSIWILADDGRILKFALGNPQRFDVTNVYPDLVNPSAIYTNEELEYFYVLDRENSRVVVLTKDGEYKAQYVSEEAKNAKGLVVSEKEKKIILLTGEKLVSVGIEHLGE